MTVDFREAIQSIMSPLVADDYDAIDRVTGDVRLRATEIAAAIAQSGRQLVLPPEAAYESIDAIPVEGSSPQEWSVWMPLWTAEEGRSDLTLQLSIIRREQSFVVELDDIHVL